MISDIKELKKSPKKIETYEQYLMSRNFYYLELNTSIYDIDKYVTRHITNITNIDITEYNTMCLLFSLSEYMKTKTLNVKGFGVFSEKKNSSIKI